MGESVRLRLFAVLLTAGAVFVSTGCGAGSSGNGATSAEQLGLVLTPNSLNFGTVNVGSGKTLPVTITHSNSNTTQLGSSVTISSLKLSGTAFSISGLTFPVTLAPAQATTFNVTFTPQTVGSAVGSASLISTAGTQPTLSLAGAGTTSSLHSVELSWIASTSPVVGYNVYRGIQSGGPYTKINSSLVAGNIYSDGTVQNGQTYYYVATAVNSQGDESVFSNETQAAIP